MAIGIIFFQYLYRLLNEENLPGCCYKLRRSAAPGLDKVTFEHYEREQDAKLANLVDSIRSTDGH